LVSQVLEDTPAENAGLQVGDVVVQLNGEPIADGSDLRNRIGLMRVGERIELVVIRDQRRMQLQTKVGEVATRQVSGGTKNPRLDGAEFRNIGPNHPRYGEVDGVEAARVAPNSRAWRNGLREGDIVLSVNRVPVSSVDQFSGLLDDHDGALALHVQRGDGRLFIVVQ
jgi:S1-C subfamily serine protease